MVGGGSNSFLIEEWTYIPFKMPILNIAQGKKLLSFLCFVSLLKGHMKLIIIIGLRVAVGSWGGEVTGNILIVFE